MPVSLKPVIEELENLFTTFNKAFFEGKLEKPVITVSPDSTKGAYGWCTSWKAWKNGDENGGFYEINLCAEYLNRPFEETCSTLIHEMVHLWNLQEGVQDTSRSGTYHNQKFKTAAEAHGLTVEKTAKYGYSKFHEQGYSWPSPRSRWCTTKLKTNIIDSYLKRIQNQYVLIQIIGLAADEQYRLERKNNQDPNHRHPLMDWGWTEADCLKYCYDRGFDWDGLYEIFQRVSCWCCPLQSLQELRKLRTHFPELWERLLDMEHRTWRKFRADYSVDQLEIRFQFEEERLAQGKPINTREFHRELKKKIKECEQHDQV